MDHSKELRLIAADIVKTEAGGLNNSQYWGMRLRVLADILESGDAPITDQSSRPDKCSAESHALKRMGGYSVCPDCDEDIYLTLT